MKTSGAVEPVRSKTERRNTAASLSIAASRRRESSEHAVRQSPGWTHQAGAPAIAARLAGRRRSRLPSQREPAEADAPLRRLTGPAGLPHVAAMAKWRRAFPDVTAISRPRHLGCGD